MAKQQAVKTSKSTTPKTTTPKEVAPDTPRSSRARTTTRKKAAALPTYQDIAARAYLRYMERGCAPGFEIEDWLAAEAELTAGRKN